MGALIVGVAGCTTVAEPDNLVLQYSGGSLEGSKFQACIDPASTGNGVVNDTNYYFPTSQRTWNIAAQGGDSSEWIRSSSKPGDNNQPGPEVGVYVKADFFLNTNCKDGKNSEIVKWWETIGRRYGADIDPAASAEEQSNDAGWRKMLENTLVPVMNSAVRRATKNFTADELDSDLNGSWAALKKSIEDGFSTELNKQGKFFCGVGYDRTNKDSCPPITVMITDVNFADSGIAAARANVFKAEQEAKAKLIAAQAQVDEAKILSQASRDPNYMRIKELENQLAQAQACAANPNCTLILGGNANVNVGAGSKK